MKKLNSTLIKLVTLLGDGEYHDSNELIDKLLISRSTLSKIIKKLDTYGIQIKSSKGSCYALGESFILLNQKIIKEETRYKDIDIFVFETLGSTNDYLKHNFSDKEIKICLSEQQTLGKARLQRSWYSPFGQNIYFSCRYFFKKELKELSGLSLVVSLAVVKTLQMYKLPLQTFVKWPNDILYDDRKISGNLIDIQMLNNHNYSAIIGIGINVNMLNDENHCINQPWTSLRRITQTYIDRNQLCVSLIDNLIEMLNQFQNKGLAYFINTWAAVDYLLNKTVSLKMGHEIFYGKGQGINHLGQLLLNLGRGECQCFSSGDTTILK